ncbi:MAG: hypothetical protein IRY85_19835 [Micromonosporaceae bacterium]|nr:hypothetical protein [Micromonosporaceae bacterium]
MSTQLHDDDVVARLRDGAPNYPDFGPDAGHMLIAARRALRRRRSRQAIGGVAAVMAVVVGLTAAGPIDVPGYGMFVMPGGYDLGSLLNQGEPPTFPRRQLLDDVGRLERHVLPVVEELGLTLYIDHSTPGGPSCRVFTWSHGAFRDRNSDCANPDDPELPFDAESTTAFTRVADAIDASGVDVYRIDQRGWGSGPSFHLQDSSWLWNWYYSYVPGTPADGPDEVRTQTPRGVRLQVHVTGDWWFTVEPDD